MNARLSRTAGALTIASLVAFAGAAHVNAQNDLLRGPQAREQGPPGRPTDFAPRQGQTGDRRPTPAMCHRLLMAAVRSLERTPEVALSADQREAIEALDRIYISALEEYRDANADAYDGLRPDDALRRPGRAAGPRGDGLRRGAAGPREDAPRRGLAGPPDDAPRRGLAQPQDDRPRRGAQRNGQQIDPAARDEMRAERRERMQALRALEMGAPSPEDIHANIRSLLDAEQRQAVDARAERLRARALDRDRRPRGARADDGARLTDQQRLRIREAVKDMTPEERREFLEALRERMRERRIEDRPAPPMDDVEVPPPGA